MVDAARRYGRVVSGGSQRVLEDYQGVVNQCWSGELGTIKSINVNVGPLSHALQPARPAGPRGHGLGHVARPRAWAPYHEYRISGSFAINGTSWRSWSDYSGGGMTDWGAHHFGGATFAVDVRELQPVEVVYTDDKDGQVPDLPLPQRAAAVPQPPRDGQHGRSSARRARSGRRSPCRPTRAKAASTATSSIACKTREKPFRDIELATNTMAVCHLGIIAYELQAVAEVGPGQAGVPRRRGGQPFPRSRPPRAVGVVRR